jgi:hypothetical protein
MPITPRRVHFVHGILDPVGVAGLLKLVPYFQKAGFDCRVPDYGLITAVETRLANPLIVRTLRPYIEPGDVYVGHSNGCAIAYDLVRGEGARPAGLVLINGALERDIKLPVPMWADVYFNSGDDATVAAVAAARLGLSDPVWGDMGHSGALHDPEGRIISIDCGGPCKWLPVVSGHSDIFTDGKVEAWAGFILERVQAHLRD